MVFREHALISQSMSLDRIAANAGLIVRVSVNSSTATEVRGKVQRSGNFT